MSDSPETNIEEMPTALPKETPASAKAGTTGGPEKRRPPRRRPTESGEQELTAAQIKQQAAAEDEELVAAEEEEVAAAEEEVAADQELVSASSVERAEAVMDQAGERVGAFVHSIGTRLRRAAALAREEAEDVVAEAQSIRRGDSSDNDSR